MSTTAITGSATPVASIRTLLDPVGTDAALVPQSAAANTTSGSPASTTAAGATSDASAGAAVLGVPPAPSAEASRMAMLRADLAAATTDGAKTAAYQKYAAQTNSDAEKVQLFKAMADSMSSAGKASLERFFAGVSSQQSKQPVTYTVVANDSVAKIAKQFGVSVSELYAANKDKIGKPYQKNGVTYMLIRPGQVLTIPGKFTAGAAGATTSTGASPRVGSAAPQSAASQAALPGESQHATEIRRDIASVDERISASDALLATYATQRAKAQSEDVAQLIDQSIEQTTYDKSVLVDLRRTLQQQYDDEMKRAKEADAQAAEAANAASSQPASSAPSQGAGATTSTGSFQTDAFTGVEVDTSRLMYANSMQLVEEYMRNGGVRNIDPQDM